MTTAPRAITPSVNGWNAEYIEQQYARFQADPTSVSADVRAFFQGFDLALSMPASGAAAAPARQATGDASEFQANVDSLLANYRRLGHIAARLDPFGREPHRPEQLTLAYHGLSAADLDRQVSLSLMNLEGTITLRELIDRLDKTYCRTIGLEFTYIPDAKERQWFLENFEATQGQVPLSREQRLSVLEQLIRAEGFERFMQKRYPGEKRFSLEGGESTIPLMNLMLESATALGVEEAVIGMAHRGRLNVLNNVMGKTYEQIFTEFEDNWEEGFADGGGDVKYHRGYSGVRTFTGGNKLHLALSSNPSHLESVDGVVCGRCRAKQRLRGDTQRTRVIPMLVHGDAALPGQGIVTECLNYSQLEGYTVGGAIHIVINNLIGFTTIPEDARSTRYCTDVAKMIDAPVFHVNGDDPEACAAAALLAIRYRQQFKKDVFIDLVCFRKYGHNEQDEQSFTQPILANLIKQHPGVLARFKERLVAEGLITQAEVDATTERLNKSLEDAQAKAKNKPFDPTIDPAGQRWKGITSTYSFDPVKTAVKAEVLDEVCQAMARTPEGFNVNPKLKGLLEQRAALARSTGALNLSHADAEQLAIGTLLIEGIPVRLSGQDCRRGTFTQRHAVLRDFITGKPYIPLNNMREMGLPGSGESEPGTLAPDGKARQARYCVYDSPLSEVSVLGFDYGYSLADPNMLVMWEAQFGDFNNGAQVLIDQYIVSSEIKWDRWSGLVMLLPHGYEGAGPEHSSCRIERFLQMTAQDNIEVVTPSTAAQIFHLLRRQVKRSFRKPLIVATPKKMLRDFTSSTEELTSGRFHEILDDPSFSGGGKAKGPDRKAVKKVILCSGKLYHELAERRTLVNKPEIALVRIEQLYPLHAKRLEEVLASFPKSAEKVWVQEEPKNAGAWTYISDAVKDKLSIDLSYLGREASASPATGSKHHHYAQQEAIIAAAIGPKPKGAKTGH